MNYLSVCSGIEAATVAWHPLGLKPWAFSEIEAFPSAVLKHYYGDVPNMGDMTRFKDWPDAAIDLLVGGTPCQSFSVAGLRKGLDDPRGSLMLTYLAIARRYSPRWLVWENVPGVLSSDEGRAFGSLLGGLAELGYGFAYRILDAQYFHLAQRRQRVFVVACLGDWRRPAAVLFERESLSGHPAPRREAGQDVAGTLGGSSQSGGFRTTDLDNQGAFIPIPIQYAEQLGREKRQNGMGLGDPGDPMYTLECRQPHGVIAFDTTQIASPSLANGAHFPAIAFANTAGDTALGMSKPGCPPITTRNGDPGNVLLGMQVRRLTPRECERLQGFPDDYTLIPYNGKPAKDGPRYKALGNSMAVPVMRWIGRRILEAEGLQP